MNSLRVQEIRPSELLEFQKEEFAKDVAWLNSRKERFVRVLCPACGRNSENIVFHKYGVSYCECENCNTVYMHPRPSYELLKEYYQQSENAKYWRAYIYPATEKSRRDKIFRPRVRKIREVVQGIDAKLLVDVGAGFGTFCQLVQEAYVFETKMFERVIAVEPNSVLANTCRFRKIETIEKVIEETTLEGVSVFTAFELIEHLFEPFTFLARCARQLAPGGRIVLTCPNVTGFETSLLWDKSSTFDIEHLNLFNRESITLLLNRCGFDVKEITTPGKLDAELVRTAILDEDYEPSSFLTWVLVDNWETLGDRFQYWLSANCLSSHMMIVGEKK